MAWQLQPNSWLPIGFSYYWCKASISLSHCGLGSYRPSFSTKSVFPGCASPFRLLRKVRFSGLRVSIYRFRCSSIPKLAFSSLIRICPDQDFDLHTAYASSPITLKFRRLFHLYLFAEPKFNPVTVRLKHSLLSWKKSRCRSDSDKIHQICTCLSGTSYFSNSSGMKINSSVTKIFNNNPCWM